MIVCAHYWAAAQCFQKCKFPLCMPTDLCSVHSLSFVLNMSKKKKHLHSNKLIPSLPFSCWIRIYWKLEKAGTLQFIVDGTSHTAIVPNYSNASHSSFKPTWISVAGLQMLITQSLMRMSLKYKAFSTHSLESVIFRLYWEQERAAKKSHAAKTWVFSKYPTNSATALICNA